MGTYTIPRNYRGESRILIIFSVKSLITTALGAAVGGLFYLLIGGLFQQPTIGWIVLGFFGLIGFAVGAFKIPTFNGIPVTKKIGGESIDEIVRRYIMFKLNKKKYAYHATKEEEM